MIKKNTSKYSSQVVLTISEKMLAWLQQLTCDRLLERSESSRFSFIFKIVFLAILETSFPVCIIIIIITLIIVFNYFNKKNSRKSETINHATALIENSHEMNLLRLSYT